MTDKNTHQPDTSQSYHDDIMILSEVLSQSVNNNNDDTPLKILRGQLKSLAQLHHLMALEAGRRVKEHGHDVGKISLALRAQNQFCRTLMVLDHLETKNADKKTKLPNELSDRDLIE